MSEREKREIQIENRAIGQAVLAAWPSEPTTDRAKRMAEIDARAAVATKGPWPSEAGWNNGGTPSRTWKIPARQDGAEIEMLAEDALFVEHAREDVPFLLAEIRDADAALTRLGIADEGRPPAERIADLGKRLHGPKCSGQCRGGMVFCEGHQVALRAEYEASKPPPPPCEFCGKPSTGPARRVGLAMRFTCSTECCLAIERRDLGDPMPAATDAPSGPLCSCGAPATHESGWCGKTCSFVDADRVIEPMRGMREVEHPVTQELLVVPDR